LKSQSDSTSDSTWYVPCVVLPRSPSYEPDPPAQHIRRGNSEHRDELQEGHFLGCNRDRIARLAWYRTHMPPAAAFQAQSSGCQPRARIPCVKHNDHAACGLSSPLKSAGRGRSALESRVSVWTRGYRPNAQVLMDIFAHTAGSYHYASCVSVKLQGRVSFAS
jgi:hypothetical protein